MNKEEEREYVEEKHRIWSAEDSEKKKQKLQFEANARKRKVVINISGHEGLGLSEEGYQLLEESTGIKNRFALSKIPRDYPALVALVYDIQQKAGRNLRIVSVPIEVDWLIIHKRGSEVVTESFRRWPVPSQEEMKNYYPFAQVVGNRIKNGLMSHAEWRDWAQKKEEDKTQIEPIENPKDENDSFFDQMENQWK